MQPTEGVKSDMKRNQRQKKQPSRHEACQLTINKFAVVDGHATNSANKREVGQMFWVGETRQWINL